LQKQQVGGIADFDGDGDIDFIAGNLGLNARYKATEQTPLCIYAKDYDKNGRIDPIMCHYVLGENVISHTRDELIKQINPMRGRFKSYHDFASSTFEKSFTKDEIKDAFVVKQVILKIKEMVFLNAIFCRLRHNLHRFMAF
jgi:enediyne biosynthesis protein E4